MRRLRWVVGIVVAAAVVVVGGTFVYIHFIEGNAPAKLALSTTPAASGSAPPLDGAWSVTAGSEAGYRVSEVIFGQNNTAVGRTSVINGSITIKGDAVAGGSFTADLTAVKSDQSQRDNQFKHRIMDVSTYPTATFTLTAPITFSAPSGDAVITASATGTLTMHGATKPVTFTVTARRNGDDLEVLGSIPVVFANWSIPSPSLAGVVTTQDHGILEFLLVLAKGAAPTTTVAPATSTTGAPQQNSAYAACMAAHGVTLPAPGGAGGPPPGGGGVGGVGGGGGYGPPPGAAGAPGQSNPTFRAAAAACASLRPAGGLGRPTISPTTVAPLGL